MNLIIKYFLFSLVLAYCYAQGINQQISKIQDAAERTRQVSQQAKEIGEDISSKALSPIQENIMKLIEANQRIMDQFMDKIGMKPNQVLSRFFSDITRLNLTQIKNCYDMSVGEEDYNLFDGTLLSGVQTYYRHFSENFDVSRYSRKINNLYDSIRRIHDHTIQCSNNNQDSYKLGFTSLSDWDNNDYRLLLGSRSYDRLGEDYDRRELESSEQDAEITGKEKRDVTTDSRNRPGKNQSPINLKTHDAIPVDVVPSNNRNQNRDRYGDNVGSQNRKRDNNNRDRDGYGSQNDRNRDRYNDNRDRDGYGSQNDRNRDRYNEDRDRYGSQNDRNRDRYNEDRDRDGYGNDRNRENNRDRNRYPSNNDYNNNRDSDRGSLNDNRNIPKETNNIHIDTVNIINVVPDNKTRGNNNLNGFSSSGNSGGRFKRETKVPKKCIAKGKDRLPQKWDWREQGKVTVPKDQGSCGSCWAFASMASLESAYLINGLSRDKNFDLSEQEIVACARQNGCRGGTAIDAYNYMLKSKGVHDEETLPYLKKNHDATCSKPKGKRAAKIKDFCLRGKYVTMNGKPEELSDNDIKKLVYEFGPLYTTMNADDEQTLKNLKNGIYKNRDCSKETNHAVVIVGYDERSWIVKNTWGTNWGDKGFFRMKRGQNLCGINTYVMFPIV